MTPLRTEPSSSSIFTTRCGGLKSIGRRTNNGLRRSAVVQLFNDYKRRHPDEVLASTCRGPHSARTSAFD